MAEQRLLLSEMNELTGIACSMILELTGEIDINKRSELERQQLGESTLSRLGEDAAHVLRAFRERDA